MAFESHILTERLGEDTVILNLKTNRFFLLNETCARFWNLLQSGMEIAPIEKQLAAEFEVDPVELSTEVKRMLRLLADEQLLALDR